MAAELMQDFPPEPEAQVTLANWRDPPFNRWAFHHVRELLPTAEIANDPRRSKPLAVEPRDLSGIRIRSGDGRLDLPGFFERAEVDGFVVLFRGELIHESYFNGMNGRRQHICMSVSKSLLGLLAGILVERDQLDTEAQATHYLPELASTAFKGATVRDLLDMRSGLHFPEDYTETEGLYVRYRKSMGWLPAEPGDAPSDQRSFLLQLTERDGAHGGPFRYLSPCTDLLGWICERAAGTRLADLMSELLWKPLGAETPAYITVDRLGAPRAAGGMCVTTRDLARIGQMIVEGGRGIVSADWIEDIATLGDAEAWNAGDFAPDYPGMPMHYRSQWYVFRDRGPLLMATGIHGQNLLVDRGTELVIAKHASAGSPSDAAGERLTLEMFEAIRNFLC
jgi:CubicO group peptidase (beta-lactamase class C family)